MVYSVAALRRVSTGRTLKRTSYAIHSHDSGFAHARGLPGAWLVGQAGGQGSASLPIQVLEKAGEEGVVQNISVRLLVHQVLGFRKGLMVDC